MDNLEDWFFEEDSKDTAPQKSQEWFKQRLGKLTGSIAFNAFSTLKNGGDSAARSALRLKLLAERLTGESEPVFVTKAMAWGVEKEKEAIEAYEYLTENKVMPCYFIECPDIQDCGASPDGLVGDDGVLEIKCPATSTFLKYVLENEIPEQYKPQMALELLATGRKWVDFVAFDPRIKNATNIFIKRYEPSAEELNEYRNKCIDFLNSIKELEDRLVFKNDWTKYTNKA